MIQVSTTSIIPIQVNPLAHGAEADTGRSKTLVCCANNRNNNFQMYYLPQLNKAFTASLLVSPIVFLAGIWPLCPAFLRWKQQMV